MRLSIFSLLAWAPAAFAQTGDIVEQPRPASGAPVIQDLKILPLAGTGGINDLERRVMAPLVVQILDRDSRPMEGADVTFRFPISGPSATFGDDQTSRTTKTNADGQAAAVGWMANRTVGTFLVQVTAIRGNEMGQTQISMTNATRILGEVKEKHKGWWTTKGGKIAIAAGAAAVITGVVVGVTHGGGGGGKVITVTGSPGSPTIGGPQ